MLLQVEQLNKAFGGLKAVNNVNFSIQSGEIVGLIGPNGFKTPYQEKGQQSIENQ